MPANLGAVALHLESQHIRVLVARDVEEALECASFSLLDVILLDIQMFDCHGFKTYRRLKTESRTALSATEDIVDGSSVGGVDYAELPEIMACIRTDLTMRDMPRRSDNGPGFDPDLAWPGCSYGRQGMGERARSMGMELRIRSAPGTGTTISITTSR